MVARALGGSSSLPFLMLACACGAAMRAGSTSPARAPGGRSVAAEGSPTFGSMADQGASVAPGMREIARRESVADAVAIVRAGNQDTCVRVAFESSAPVIGKLLDGGGNVLAVSSTAATQGILGDRGPVCVRKGDTVSAIAEGASAPVRWVAWAAP